MHYLFLFFLITVFSIHSQDQEQKSNLEYSGSFRVRALNQSRDIILSRQTTVMPVTNKSATLQSMNDKYYNAILSDIVENRMRGKQSTLTPNNENVTYFDNRALLNLNFVSSKSFDAVIGFQAGDIPFGGKPTSSNRNDPYTLGDGSGGELGSASGINLKTNFLYINYKSMTNSIRIRTGIQLFSSVQGRVMYSTGAGVQIIKDIRSWNTTVETGWIKARSRNIVDADGNGFNDKKYIGNDVLFAKMKFNFIRNLKNELYSYYQNDSDRTDISQETGSLYWHGLYNEITTTKWNVILHGVYNHGVVKAKNSYRNNEGEEEYFKRDRHSIKGALFDLQVIYHYTEKISFNWITIGTTGRPGYEKNGVESFNKGNGYRTLAPGFAVSNIAIDFTGAYALFDAKSMNGLVEHGVFSNLLLFGPFQFTFGYYHLYAYKSPHIANNLNYSEENGYKTNSFLGREYNFNIRWNATRDMQVLLRSGVFFVENGFKAMQDTRYGKRLSEVFITFEYRF